MTINRLPIFSSPTALSELHEEREVSADEASGLPPRISSQADALLRLQKRAVVLERLMHQPADQSRTSTAAASHLFAGEAEGLLASLQSSRENLSGNGQGLLQNSPPQSLLPEVNGLSDLPEDDSSKKDESPSFKDILEQLQKLIGTIRDDYLDVYASLVEKYSKLFADFNSEILAKLEKWIQSKGDKGNIELDCSELSKALDALIKKYSYPNPDAIVYPMSKDKGISKEDAEKWLKAMGLSESCLKKRDDGTYCVVLDLGPLNTMKGNLPGTGKEEMSAAKFQAWQAAFNAQQQEMETALQKFTQKYSNANSIHDNTQKMISSTLSSLFDMLKSFAQALA
ncbi:IpaD/SipD/SspD family type III secretion system needle tip protein [Pseudomonas sp. NPDC090202]|uniref:IpaD/SipD/SspD family type III secretion system needle tip protein n=1 Tax=unclassified Pseudomonas TaxID=196821 RepID=UPI0037F741EC